METVFGSKQTTQVMHVHFNADDRPEYVQIQATPLLDDQGEVLYMGEFIYPVNTPEKDDLLVGRSRTILRMTSLLQRVAPTMTTVLLTGESGAGKECVAKYLHQYSSRPKEPFIIVDCGTLGENLIENELFGSEKGAYTGSTMLKKGLFEAAHGGTLLIDEVCELPLALQTKLLRVLETGAIRRIGGTNYHKIDVRVIAATNRDIQQMVDCGEFRQDLYYRLSAFPVHVPPLRERKSDIPAIAEHFLGRSEDGDRHLPLPPEVIEALLAHDYPGNIRELRNIIERAAILAADSPIGPEHLVLESGKGRGHNGGWSPSPELGRATGHGLASARRRIDDTAVLAALEETGGHRARAARLLGVSERTLYRHVRRLRAEET
jgi:transcriptional regulator with GAF, ATPase, and Fis domain